MPSPLQSRSDSDGEFVPQTFGSSGGSIPCNPSRITQHSPISMVDKKPKYLSRCHPHRTISVTRGCVLTLKTWTSSKFLRKGVWLGTCFRCETVTTDASLTGWRAVCQGRPAHGTWTEAHRGWHINRLELLAVFLKTKMFYFSKRPSCVSQDGQHNGLCHIWITEEDYALAPMQEECPSVVSDDLSGSRPGAPELQSGHALETKSGGRGMEAAPSNGELHMASVWRSGSGLIRIEHDYALPAMVLPSPPITL